MKRQTNTTQRSPKLTAEIGDVANRVVGKTDTLQLLKGSSRRSQDNRQLEISEISAGIKALAKELNIPIIVIAQLNRQPELRGNGKPRL